MFVRMAPHTTLCCRIHADESEQGSLHGGYSRRPLTLDAVQKGEGREVRSLIVIAAVTARQYYTTYLSRYLGRQTGRGVACVARPRQSSWAGLPPLRRALPGSLHATCHLPTSVAARSHAALPPRPDFTCIACTSRHATTETAAAAAPAPAPAPASALLLALAHSPTPGARQGRMRRQSSAGQGWETQ